MFRQTTQIFTSCILGFCLFVGDSQADSPAVVLKPDTNTFVEKYDETVDVAGQLRAGLMYGSTVENVDIDDLRMDLKLQTVINGETACIRVASRNGVFSATWEITLETGVGEQVITGFPTQYKKILEKFTPDKLVAIASVVAPDQNCTAERVRYLPTSWGDPDNETIVAYLNADSTDARIAGKKDKETQRGKCRILPSSDENTAFDTICTLPMNLTNSGATSSTKPPIELVVIRNNFSTVMKRIRYLLSGS